jgi:DNA excision repair protein ERCC-5
VEEFNMGDVERELGLDREGLVRLALLLGSDYTEGCQGGRARRGSGGGGGG